MYSEEKKMEMILISEESDIFLFNYFLIN